MGNVAGIVSGLLSKGGANMDMSQLFATIQQAGAYQQQIINALPAEIQKNLATYAASQNKAGSTYQSNINDQTQKYLQQVSGLYGPNSAAGTAQKAANTQAAYASVPGTSNAIRNALAATGGLQRGQAGTALASPYVAAAQQAGQANMNVNAQQTQMQQQATQQALATINSMDAAMFQNLFGMSKDQATMIMQQGNQALQQQLAQLINQSNNQTNQMLGVEGVAATNKYNNDTLDNQRYNSIMGNAVNLGLNGITAAYGGMGGFPGIMSGLGGGMSGLPSGADVSSDSYLANMAANAPQMIQSGVQFAPLALA